MDWIIIGGWQNRWYPNECQPIWERKDITEKVQYYPTFELIKKIKTLL